MENAKVVLPLDGTTSGITKTVSAERAVLRGGFQLTIFVKNAFYHVPGVW
jgi:hypothetical protein